MCVCLSPPPSHWQLRVLSYGEGDFFLPHWDERAAIGASRELPEAASFLTLLLYLSSAETAGSGATRISCPPSHAGSARFDQYEGTPAMGRAGCTVVEGVAAGLREGKVEVNGGVGTTVDGLVLKDGTARDRVRDASTRAKMSLRLVQS